MDRAISTCIANKTEPEFIDELNSEVQRQLGETGTTIYVDWNMTHVREAVSQGLTPSDIADRNIKGLRLMLQGENAMFPYKDPNNTYSRPYSDY